MGDQAVDRAVEDTAKQIASGGRGDLRLLGQRPEDKDPVLDVVGDGALRFELAK